MPREKIPMSFSSRNDYFRLLSYRTRHPLLLAGLLGFFAYSSFNLLVAALPLYYQRTLGLSLAQTGLLVGFSFLLNFLAYFTIGIAADRSGGASYILWGALGLTLTAPLFGLFYNVWLLALVSLGRGFTMSVCALSLNAFAGEIVDPEQRGAQMGFFGMFTNTASALAPALGVSIYQLFGNQALFLSALIAGGVAVVLAILLSRQKGRTTQKIERITPALWLSGLPRLWQPAIAMLAMGIAWGAVLAFMPGYLGVHGVSNPGLFYTADLISQLGLRTVAGRLSDRYGRPLLAGLGLLFLGVSVFSLFLITNNIETLLAGLLAGAGWATFGPVLMAWLLDLTPLNRRGLASATYFSAQDLGRILGSLGLGYLVVVFGTSAPFSFSSAITVVVSFVMFLFALLIIRKERRLPPHT